MIRKVVADLLPNQMFVSGRAICPHCGAPVDIESNSASVPCEFCGLEAAVERRLRKMEPEIEGAAARKAGDWTPAHEVAGASEWTPSCPGCGAPVPFNERQGLATCGSCEGEVKIERRMRLLPPEPLPPEKEPKSEEVLDALFAAKTPEEQAPVIQQLNRPLHINWSVARRIHDIYSLMKTCDKRISWGLCEVVLKLLCDKDRTLGNHLYRVAQDHVFDVNGSMALMWGLGMGKSIGLKLALDTAQYAIDHGANDYGCMAGFAANAIYSRNHVDKKTTHEIVCYRLIYLTGPILYWAVGVANGELGLRVLVPARDKLRLIDDCAFERPELVPYLKKRMFRGDERPSIDEAIQISREYLSPQARIAALELFLPTHELAKEDFAAYAAEVAPFLEFREAEEILIELMRIGDEVPPVIHELVEKRRDDLPEDLRRRYLREVPDCRFLSPVPRFGKRRHREDDLPPEVRKANADWNAGIKRVLADREKEIAGYRKLLEA